MQARLTAQLQANQVNASVEQGKAGFHFSLDGGAGAGAWDGARGSQQCAFWTPGCPTVHGAPALGQDQSRLPARAVAPGGARPGRRGPC